MRSAKPFAAALVVVTLGALAFAPGAQAHLPCPRPGAELLASNGILDVYRYPLTNKRYPPPRRTEACAARSGVRMTLFDPDAPLNRFGVLDVGVMALSKTVVAYFVQRVRADSGGRDIFLAEVTSRRVIRELPGDGFADGGFLGRTRITDFALDPSGSAAWIEEELGPLKRTLSSAIEQSKTFTVRAAPLGRGEAVLEEGPNIAPRSMTLKAGTLSWKNAGVTRTARLSP